MSCQVPRGGHTGSMRHVEKLTEVLSRRGEICTDVSNSYPSHYRKIDLVLIAAGNQHSCIPLSPIELPCGHSSIFEEPPNSAEKLSILPERENKRRPSSCFCGTGACFLACLPNHQRLIFLAQRTLLLPRKATRLSGDTKPHASPQHKSLT